MEVPRTADQIRDVNTRYHDVAAASYDSKWAIDFGELGQAQVIGKIRKVLGAALEGGFDRSLEVGAGTGYFSLNLLRAGIVRHATCTDISPGMLRALLANAQRLRLDVKTTQADVETLPFPEHTFDLVVGHAVLHHIPGLERAFGEFHRVLKPGGWIVFAGEPSRFGDRLASVPKRGALAMAPIWRWALRASPTPPPPAGPNGSMNGDGAGLEKVVDIHAFSPDDLARFARVAGFVDVRVRGEELLANWFGWFNRGLESTADPAGVPMLWRQYAFRGYLLLQRVDERLLEPRLPPAIFYNLLLAARRP